MSTDRIRRIERKISQARWVLGFERLWAALLWPALVAGLALALTLSGLLLRLPDAARWAALAVLLLAFAVACRPLLRLRPPGHPEAMTRIEQASALDHQPVAAVTDHLAGPEGEPHMAALWQEHRLRQLQRLDHAKVGQPRSDWRDRDPMALRVPVALALVASFLLGGSALGNMQQSLRLMPLAQPIPATLDAWLKPPAYTGKPPVLLTSPAMVAALAKDPEIVTPENAMLSVRATGLSAPKLLAFPPEAGADAKPLSDVTIKQTATADGFSAEAAITHPLTMRLMDGSREVSIWSLSVLPDAAPTISLREPPSGDASGALSVKWKAADDYGVTTIDSEIALSDNQDDGVGFESSGVFLFDAPNLPVKVPHGAAKQPEGVATADLTEHPWAGLMVDIVLTAHDAAGHEASSPTVTFRLPEREFFKPLARALIEQRKRLIMDPDTSANVAALLRSLLIYPEGLIDRSGTHIAIATVISRLDNAASTDDVDDAVRALWRIAVNIEEGSAADARAELESLRKQLEKALAEGASPDKIRQLTDKMRQALDRYMQALGDEARKQMQQGTLQQNQDGKPISQNDLQKMLDDIDKLAQSGANDAARQMLSQLDDILRNMKPGSGQQQGDGGDQPMGKLLDQLTDLMRKQQGLMDETQRMQPPDGAGEDGMDENGMSGEAKPGEGMGNPGNDSGQGNALGDRQRGLGDALSDALREMGKLGLKGPPSLGEAGRSMKGAEDSLRQGDQPGALGQQGQAMSKLREGTRDLLRQMLQQGRGQNQMGSNGDSRGDDRDPLGRPRANRNEDYGPDRNMLPSERALRRAQEILDELRARSNTGDRPKLERDYIDRLLRGLY